MSSSTSRGGGSDQPPTRRLMRTQTAGNIGETAFDSEIVPSSLVEIAPILRVANEVEKHNPRVAYLCKFFIFLLQLILNYGFSIRNIIFCVASDL